MNMSASDFLKKADAIMLERGKQYDGADKERSMGNIVAAFNAIKGSAVLTESDGWLFMAVLKMVRDNKSKPHQDSCEDLIAYSALYAESRMNINNPANIKPVDTADNDGWIKWEGGDCPVDDYNQKIQAELGNKTKHLSVAGCFEWQHDSDKATNIIAYRLVK